MTDSPGFAVYVHWPFCAQKCPYCDFNSHVRHGGWDEPRYLAAYLRELATTAERIGTNASAIQEMTAHTRPRPSTDIPLPSGEGRGVGRVRASHRNRVPRIDPPPPNPPPRGGGIAPDLQEAEVRRGERGQTHVSDPMLGATDRPTAQARELTSIFFGGGTPSLMQPETVGGIIDAIARRYSLAAACEITLEANPGSVEAGRFRGYRAAGVNRVSLGVQSLDDAQLKRLGRIHSVADALAAIDIAKATFDRVSFDLIYARPGQTERDWEAELARALAMQAGHLSLYQLTIEEGTPFAALHKAGKLVVPEPQVADRLYAITQDMTEAAGLPAYEISNHARPGEESRHNLVYWRYGEYLGIGPGAHGREHRADGVYATVTERNPEAWLARVERDGHGSTEQTLLSRDEQADELLLMGLRLAEGVDLARLATVGGVTPSRTAMTRLVDLGMIERIGNSRIRATRAGRFVTNELVRQLALSFEAT